MKAFIGVLVFAAMIPQTVIAQGGLPGTAVVATPRLRSVSMVGDTTTITYSVLVSASSPDHLFGFTIFVPAPTRTVVSPGAETDWGVTNLFEGQTVAGWWAMNKIAPGDSTPSLVFKAVGLPGIDKAWMTGDSVLKPWGSDTMYYPAYDWLASLSAKTVAVGTDPAPTGSIALAARLQMQSDSACALGWITSSSLCSTLHTNSGNDSYATINQFGVSLDSARSGGSAVSDAAYWLLKPNATYVLAHTTPPALSADITGDTATSIYTAHPSGGVPAYSYYWEWCAIDCGGGGGSALRAPARPLSRGVQPNTVVHGWHDVGYDTASICWTMSESTLRMTITDTHSTQVVAYYTVPVLEHVC